MNSHCKKLNVHSDKFFILLILFPEIKIKTSETILTFRAL